MLSKLSRQLRLTQANVQQPILSAYVGAIDNAYHKRTCGYSPFSFTRFKSSLAPAKLSEHDVDDCSEALPTETTESSLNTDQPILSNFLQSVPKLSTGAPGTASAQQLESELPDEPWSWLSNPRRLLIESDIGHNQDIGGRLVDDSRFQYDFTLWKELLLYRQRQHGDDGVIDIWWGLTKRCPNVLLPTEGKLADFLWETFIGVALKDDYLLREVQEYAERIWNEKGTRWKPLYQRVVGAFVEAGIESRALAWHQALKHIHLHDVNGIACVFDAALATQIGMSVFHCLCRSSEGHRIYTSVIPSICKKGEVTLALDMHYFLLQRGDAPSSIEDVQPLIELLHKKGRERTKVLLLEDLVTSGMLPPVDAASSKSGDISDQAAISHSDNQAEALNDNLTARLFITNPFDFDLILAGFRGLGVKSIGPLTLREMALRTADIAELRLLLSALEDSGITTGTSVFAKVLNHLVSCKDQVALQNFISSDQQPDAIENLETQESVLYHSFVTEDWPQVRLSFTILSFLPSEDPYSYNIQLRNAVKLKDSKRVLSILRKMKHKTISPSPKTIDLMNCSLLPRIEDRYTIHRANPTKPRHKDIMQLFAIFQYVTSYGGYISPESWGVGLEYLAKDSRWLDLKKICLWLVEHYRPTRSLGSSYCPDSPLGVIFHTKIQEAILRCSFPSRSKLEKNQTLEFRGLHFLKYLRRKGVYIEKDIVQEGVQNRIQKLAGEKYSIAGQILWHREEYKIFKEKLMEAAERVWGKSLSSSGTDDTNYIPGRGNNR